MNVINLFNFTMIMSFIKFKHFMKINHSIINKYDIAKINGEDLYLNYYNKPFKKSYITKIV